MKKLRFMWRSGWVLALFMGLLLAGSCPPAAAGAMAPAATQSATGTLTIAVLGPMTGGASALGLGERDGVTLAVEQQNARGGLLGQTVEIKVYDTQCVPASAQAAAQQAIIQDGLRYIIGDICSSASTAVAQVANANGALQVTPTSTSPTVTQKEDGTVRPYTFRACFIDPLQGRAAAKFAQVTLGAHKAFVMYDGANDYSQGLAAAFMAEAGARSVSLQSETYASGTTNFSTILGHIAAMNPDIVYLADYYTVANPVAAQARAMGLTVPFMGGDGWDSTDLDFAALDGSYFTNHFSPEDTRREVGIFDQQFSLRFNYLPTAAAALGYDAANLVFRAVDAAGTLDASVVKDWMPRRVLRGVTGFGPFDALHDPIKTVVIMKVTNTVTYKAMNAGAHFYADVDLVEPQGYLPFLKR